MSGRFGVSSVLQLSAVVIGRGLKRAPKNMHNKTMVPVMTSDICQSKVSIKLWKKDFLKLKLDFGKNNFSYFFTPYYNDYFLWET